MNRWFLLIGAPVCLLAALTVSVPEAQVAAAAIIEVETSRGAFAFETFPRDAPVTVGHVVRLVSARFYDGQRIHRAVPGFVVQFGDPRSRDLSLRELWGRGPTASSGTPVGLAEITKKRPHRRGSVGLAHMGIPAQADSQIYITLAPRPDLDGRYTVFGQVVEGTAIPETLAVGDVITRVSVRE
jgi:cyclophilin family peptidyl-prolyl cis-trans isomerase